MFLDRKAAAPRARPSAFLGFLALGLALGCAACGTLPQRSRWIRVQPPLAGLDSEWDRTDEAIVSGLRVKVMNSVQDLHISLNTDDETLQNELSGQYGQSLVFWFGTRPAGHGLRIDFKAKPNPPIQSDAIDMMDLQVTLLGPSGEGYPRPWSEGTEGIELSARMSSGTLIYELRVPLAPAAPGGFGLGFKAGAHMDLSVECTQPPEALPADQASAPEAQSESVASALGPAFPGPAGFGGRMGRPRMDAAGAMSRRRRAAGGFSMLMPVELSAPPYGQR